MSLSCSSTSSRKKAVVPATQAGPSSQRTEVSPPLAPLHRTRSSFRRSTRHGLSLSQKALSSSPSRRRLTRAERRRGRDDEEVSDVVPPSDDDEYDEWRGKRWTNLVMTNHGLSSPIDYSRSYGAMDEELRETGATGIRPKKPDKSVENVRKKSSPFVLIIADPAQRSSNGRCLNGDSDMYYASLFSPAPSSPVDSTSSPESPSSTATTPTRHLTLSEEDPDFPLCDGDGASVPPSITEGEFRPHLIEPWDGKDDELDFLDFSPPGNTDRKIHSQSVNMSSLALDKSDHQKRRNPSNGTESNQVGEEVLKDVIYVDLDRPLRKSSPSLHLQRWSLTPETIPLNEDGVDEATMDDTGYLLRSPTPETLPVERDEFDETMMPALSKKTSPLRLATQAQKRTHSPVAGDLMISPRNDPPSSEPMPSQKIPNSPSPAQTTIDRRDHDLPESTRGLSQPSRPQDVSGSSPTKLSAFSRNPSLQPQSPERQAPASSPQVSWSPPFMDMPSPSPPPQSHTPMIVAHSLAPTSTLFEPSVSPSRNLESQQRLERTTRRPTPRDSSPAADLSTVFAAIEAPAPPREPTPPPPAPPADPALEHFRTTRTFRTRTVVQLQPYTKERQIYEAQLRKGRIQANNKRSAHRAKEVSQEDEDAAIVSQSSEASVSESSEAEGGSANDEGERIVIGGSADRPPKTRTPLPLVDADFDEYILAHGIAPDLDDMDEKTRKQLQKIARMRVRKEKGEERRASREERERKRFERVVRDIAEGEEREKRRQEKEKERELRLARAREREERRQLKAALEAARAERRTQIRQQRQPEPEENDSQADRELDEFLNGLRSDDESEDESGRERPRKSKIQKMRERRARKVKEKESQTVTDDDEFGRFWENQNKSTEVEESFADRDRRRKVARMDRPNCKRTPGIIRTYGSTKDRHRNHSIPCSDPESIMPLSTRPRENLSTQSGIPLPTSESHQRSTSYHSALFQHSPEEGFGQHVEYDGFGYESPGLSYSPPPEHVRDSLDVDDLIDPAHPRPSVLPVSGTNPHPAAENASDDSPDSSNSSDEALRRDPRRRIAERMMPAAMLRRLEAEAAQKERDRAECKRKEQRERETRNSRGVTSPLRPGRAVVRRGEGQDITADMAGLFSESDSASDIQVIERPASGEEDHPIIVDDESDSSEAVEDNAGESLARLHRGDFEGIVAGRRRMNVREGRQKQGRRAEQRLKATRRPVLRLAMRNAAGGNKSNSAGNATTRQTRLNFPAAGDSPRQSPNKKRKRPSNSRVNAQRPAIQLDDDVIFAADDFDFDAEDEEHIPGAQASRPRQFERVKSTTPVSIPVTNVLDAGVGKARSWANFDRFPVDFDISPLPSGLYCNPHSIPGSGKLNKLIMSLRYAESYQVTMPPMVREYGIELTQYMSPLAIQEVVGIVFAASYQRLLTIANTSSHNGELLLAPIEFFGKYIAGHENGQELFELRAVTQKAVEDLSTRLDAVETSQITNQAGRDALLKLRWELLELACRLQANALQGQENVTLVQHCVFALLKQLLSVGFDKTIRPLKAIMRGESESPEITDTSITLWIAVLHTASAWDIRSGQPDGTTFLLQFDRAIDAVFHLDQTGPIAAERIWYLIFGLCALSQFNDLGQIGQTFSAVPRWTLVRRAVSMIKVAFNEEAEKRAQPETLRGRDRYIKTMMARCVRLSSVWKWFFDRQSFSVATRNLGVIFKDRQYRNLPSEVPVDYPHFITQFNMSLTAVEDTKRETAFELYLRLVCVAASDIISSAESLDEAHQAEKDVQRLIMSIIPVSAVKFNRILPPSARELAQLINRYSIMIAACYFSPSLLTYLIANSKKWSTFQLADFDSRQICIRGLMYLAVACRHHDQSLEPVVGRLAEILRVLQGELEAVLRGPVPAQAATKIEIERTMVLVVTCFRQMIEHYSFDVEEQAKPAYPDPSLLHESWTIRIFDLDLSKDLKCGLEVVATIQSYLDARASALPQLARRRRRAKESYNGGSVDEYSSMGIDFTRAEVLALGGDDIEADPVDDLDNSLAEIIDHVISPRIYRLLSDMLPPVPSEAAASSIAPGEEKQLFITKLTKCWSDCAAILVIEHQRLDWTTFISPFGRQSWARLGNEKGRIQVGLHFMLNVANLDPGSFDSYSEDYIALLFQSIGTDRLTIEHKYLSTLVALPDATMNPILSKLSFMQAVRRGLNRTDFMELRQEVLQVIFRSLAELLRAAETAASTKSFIYRCINLFVSSLVSYDKSINSNKVLHKQSYRTFLDITIADLRRLVGDFVTPLSVPALKYFQQ
ncbi:hypothetical protein I352_05483 [Cryptococcus deuterogattii MMRL2647]|nr:hypothetical protein I352_05483 [Cryptococcus deuterogattii MMRL2647]